MGIGIALVAGGSAYANEPVAPSAAETPADPEPAAAPLPIVVVGGPAVDPGLRQVLQEAQAHLQAQGVELSLVEPEAGQTAAGRARTLVREGKARGVFWLDERDPEEIRVFLLDPQGSAYVRRVPVDPEGVEASREAVWLIVESGSLALVSGEAVAMEQAAAEDLRAEPEVEPPLHPPSSSEPSAGDEEPVAPLPGPTEPTALAVRGRVGLSYLGVGFARSIPWSSGVALDGALDLGPRWRLALGYGLLLPWRSGDPVVTWRHRAELRGGPRFEVHPRVELHALVGGGLEAVRWRERAGDGAGWRVTGLVGLDGGLSVRLVATLMLVVEPGVGLLINRFDFVECAQPAARCEGALRRVVLEPWRVRPRARVGLAVGF